MSFCASCTADDKPLIKRDGFVLCIECAGGTTVTGKYGTPLERRREVKRRRDALRAANQCICGPLVGNVGRSGAVHGPPVVGGRCRRCDDVKRGAA